MINLNKHIFDHSNPYTIGVEEEYMLCSPDTGELVPRANDIMNHISIDMKRRLSYELILSEIEVNTPICKNVNEAIKNLIELRKYIRDLGKKFNYKIGISGTHPTADPLDQKFVDNEGYNWVKHQMQYYARENITFALHVHIAVSDAETAIHVVNGLRRWIPPLLSLSANSPFFNKQNTGMRSSRTIQFGTFPRTHIPPTFKNYSEYEKITNKFIEMKTIDKTRQIWWKIRPHYDYGTIEFRICDMQRSLKNIELLIATCQALVFQAVEDYHNGKLVEDLNIELLNDGLWKATRFNSNALVCDSSTEEIITLNDFINRMFKYSSKALSEFGNSNIVQLDNSLFNWIPECDQQLNIFNELGFNGLKKFLIDSVEYKYN